MNTESSKPLHITASGARTVAAQEIRGLVATGDHVDIRTTVLGAKGIPQPMDVSITAGLNNLPRPPTTPFVGRHMPMAQLEQALSDRTGVAIAQAVHGLGGVGKSELALQYAHAHSNEYKLVWWVTADDAAQIEASFASLTERLCPQVMLVATTRAAAEWAISWLQTHADWLMILDNADDPEHVEPVLGQLHGGSILLTTRRDIGWKRYAESIKLDVLAPEAAINLITAVHRSIGPTDTSTASAIAAELGYLPLALDQAAAYIAQTRITLDGYLMRLRQHPDRMYATAIEGGKAQQTIARLWDISLHSIEQRNPNAVWMLRVLAHFAPDNIPRAILRSREASDHNPSDQVDIDDAVALLASYSMITLTAESISVHRLVQAVLLATPELSDDRPSPTAFDTALDWLLRALPYDPGSNIAEWPLFRGLAPHVDRVTEHYTNHEEPQDLGLLLNEMAIFFSAQGDYQRALQLRISALRIMETAAGHAHPETVTCLCNLASTYWDLGQYSKALPLEERALAITEATLGSNHPSTGVRLGNLGLTYRDLGRYADAVHLSHRALTVMETVHGSDHPDTATALSNLASIYQALGQANNALPLARRALSITEATLGPGHPHTAIALNNLASLYGALGRPAKSLSLEQRALAIYEATVGPNHPHVSSTLSNIAVTYSDMGHNTKALPLAEKALAITEAVVGPDHPDMAVGLANLALIHNNLGHHVEALRLAARGRRIAATALGPNHDTTRALVRLAAQLRDEVSEF